MEGRTHNDFGWFRIARLGLVMASLGAVVVLTTSTLNRLMAVELGLAATVPGALVTLHHVMQLLRPRMGYGSDGARRLTPRLLLGMVILASGGFLAAVATAWMATSLWLGLLLGVAAYALIGAGASLAGTLLLVLMAKRVAAERRAAAATLVWTMMIASFAITAGTTGALLDPFSYDRLVFVAGGVSVVAVVLTALSLWGLEGDPAATPTEAPERRRGSFREALAEVWSEPDARRFTLFILVSMLAYSAQDLILEPFAGAVFGWSPGATTKLSGAHHGGALLGMILIAVVTSRLRGTVFASLKAWVVGGCVGSGLCMLGLMVAGLRGGGAWPVQENVFLLGVSNGVYASAAIAGMMALAHEGHGGREGTRMGLWGAAQALAMGAGGFLGTVLVDAAASLIGRSGAAYAFVFGLEAVGFFVAQYLASKTPFPSVRVTKEPASLQPQLDAGRV